LTAGAWCFVIGSFNFLLGTCINLLMDTTYPSTLVQMRLTAVTASLYMLGSLLFTVASIPYLFPKKDQDPTLLAFLAWEYIIGSVCFLFGGWCNYGKARTMLKNVLDALTGHGHALDMAAFYFPNCDG
jgi:hypothetical protein